MSERKRFKQWADSYLNNTADDIFRVLPAMWAAWQARAGVAEQRSRELEAWIPQAYKEGYQDAQNDESEGFEGDWEVSMAKMVLDEKLEPPR